MITFGSLFAGIGGMDLGFERAGFTCSWQVEIDDYATRVLEKHWPGVHRERDVRNCGKHNLKSVDCIVGGFPCQDISSCNNNAQGIEGSKSGLWSEYRRIICELQPKYAVIENVRYLVHRGLAVVLRDLAAAGYSAQWQTISCWMFGSHHKRERVYIVANRSDTDSIRWERRPHAKCEEWSHAQFTGLVRGVLRTAVSAGNHARVSDGIPHRVDRLRGLGNAVVPQVAEYIGNLINQRLSHGTDSQPL